MAIFKGLPGSTCRYRISKMITRIRYGPQNMTKALAGKKGKEPYRN
jgi:hypothetical protein